MNRKIEVEVTAGKKIPLSIPEEVYDAIFEEGWRMGYKAAERFHKVGEYDSQKSNED